MAETRSIGPYALLREVGRGGQGAVWLARDTRRGGQVALKTVLPRSGEQGALRREIEALRRVSALGHPGIVQVLDHGVEGGMPWLTMEWIAGPNLRQHLVERLQGTRGGEGQSTEVLLPTALRRLEDSPGGPAPLGEALELALRLTSPLAFLHGEGIVHRDLKPENVLVRGDGNIVIVDFGLAARFSGEIARETLQVDEGIVGTVAYMAPEQCRGEIPDARADLYALGCILYELLTGSVPFQGRTAGDVLLKHLSAEPEPPSVRRPLLPAAVDALVLSLLRKDPADRPGYAQEVGDALRRLGAPGMSESGPRARTYLYRPVMTGRDEALARLAEATDAAQAGSGSVVLLEGESGVGKTRLAEELALRARDRGLQILVGTCEAADPRPLQGFLGPLLQIADRSRGMPEEEAELLLQGGILLARYQPALAATPCVARATIPAELPQEAARYRLFRTLQGTLTRLAEGRGLLLVVEDAQWADELTLSFLEHVAGGEALRRARLCLVVTARSEELPEALQRLRGQAGVRHVGVPRLDDAGVARMTSGMLGMEEPPEELVPFLRKHAEGNPFYVAEYLRLAVFEGVLGRGDRRWVLATGGAGLEKVGLPSAIQDVIGRHLAGISGDAREILDVAAISGRVVDEPLLQAVTGWPEARLDGALDTLRRRQVLDQAPSGSLQFAHDKMREVAEKRMSAAGARDAHRAVAQALAAMEPRPSAAVLARLAHHWIEAGEVARTRDAAWRAAEGFAKLFANADAERMLRLCLAHTAEPSAEGIQVRLALEEILSMIGRTPDADGVAAVALEHARALADRTLVARATSRIAKLRRITGRASEAVGLYREALAIARADGLREDEGIFLGHLALTLQDLGEVVEAEQLYREALAVARRLGHRQGEAHALGNLANLLMDLGHLDEARPCYEAALAIHVETGNLHLQAVVIGNLGNHFRSLGQMPQALALYEAAARRHREIGQRRFEAITLNNLALIRRASGEAEVATKHLRRAVKLLREVRDQGHLGLALANLSSTLADDPGGRAEARELLREGLTATRAAGVRQTESLCVVCLAELDIHDGKLDDAEAALREALALQHEIGARRFEAQTLRIMSGLHRRRGRPAAARDAAAQAAALAAAIGSLEEEIRATVELGLARVLLGEQPAAELAQAETLVARLPPGSSAAQDVGELRRAVAGGGGS